MRQLFENECEVYEYYEHLMARHLRYCRICDMDDMCDIADRYAAERKLKLLDLDLYGFTYIEM